jgi:diamine N-acetyltransferase
VSGVRESILEAAEERDARALYWAIYDGETPVGFVMIADEVDSLDYVAHFLWKLLIDERYQRRGFGTATLDLIVDYFRNRGVGTMWTSVDKRAPTQVSALAWVCVGYVTEAELALPSRSA